MEGIRQYLLSVVAASLIAGLVIRIVGKKGAHATVTKLLIGLFLSITVISPWTKLQIGDLSNYLSKLETDASDIVANGEAIAIDDTAAIIKDSLEAYILDKASSLALVIEVDVNLTLTNPPQIDSVEITGAASPYARQRLQQILSEELGIPRECQSWT